MEQVVGEHVGEARGDRTARVDVPREQPAADELEFTGLLESFQKHYE